MRAKVPQVCFRIISLVFQERFFGAGPASISPVPAPRADCAAPDTQICRLLMCGHQLGLTSAAITLQHVQTIRPHSDRTGGRAASLRYRLLRASADNLYGGDCSDCTALLTRFAAMLSRPIVANTCMRRRM
jgi:hypothetical protein